VKEYTFTRVVKQVAYETYEVVVKADSLTEATTKAIAGDWATETHVGEASETEYLASGMAIGKHTDDDVEEDAFLRCTEQMDPLSVDD